MVFESKEKKKGERESEAGKIQRWREGRMTESQIEGGRERETTIEKR